MPKYTVAKRTKFKGEILEVDAEISCSKEEAEAHLAAGIFQKAGRGRKADQEPAETGDDDGANGDGGGDGNGPPAGGDDTGPADSAGE